MLHSVLKLEELKPVQNLLVQIIILDIVFQETWISLGIWL